MWKDDEILFEDSQRACRFLKILPPLCLKEIQLGRKTIICDWIYEHDTHLHAVHENLHQTVISNKETVPSQHFLICIIINKFLVSSTCWKQM